MSVNSTFKMRCPRIQILSSIEGLFCDALNRQNLSPDNMSGPMVDHRFFMRVAKQCGIVLTFFNVAYRVMSTRMEKQFEKRIIASSDPVFIAKFPRFDATNTHYFSFSPLAVTRYDLIEKTSEARLGETQRRL